MIFYIIYFRITRKRIIQTKIRKNHIYPVIRWTRFWPPMFRTYKPSSHRFTTLRSHCIVLVRHIMMLNGMRYLPPILIFWTSDTIKNIFWKITKCHRSGALGLRSFHHQRASIQASIILLCSRLSTWVNLFRMLSQIRFQVMMSFICSKLTTGLMLAKLPYLRVTVIKNNDN